MRVVAVVVAVLGGMAPPMMARAQKTLSLDQAYALALTSHPSMEVLRARVAQAEAARRRAWVAVKPTVNVRGTFTHYDQEIVVDFAESSPIPLEGVEPIVIQKQDQFGFDAAATLPLFRYPAYTGIRMAKKGVELARLGEVRSRQDFLLRVAQAYYQVVAQEETVRALEHKLQVSLEHLTAARAKLEVGQAPRATVLRADLVRTQDEQQLHAQRVGLQAGKRQLAILVGEPGVVEVARPAPPASPAGASEQLIDVALHRRVDLKAARLSLELAELGVDLSWHTFLPMLDLTWLYRWTEAAGFANKKGSWNLMLVLSLPLYDAGARYADLREGRAKVAEARAQQRTLRQAVAREIVGLRAQVEAAEAGVASAVKALALAKTTEQDMATSFKVGVATQLDLLDASQRLLEAELQLTQSRYNRDLARLSLAHAVGTYDPLRRAP